MVADSQTDSERDATQAKSDEPEAGHSVGRGGLRRLISSITRLIDLQYRIWLTQFKLVAMRIAISGGMLIGAAILGVLAIIFLCIGLFHVLTDVVGLPEWAAFLIFGGILALIALILVLIVVKMLTRTEAQDAKEGAK